MMISKCTRKILLLISFLLVSFASLKLECDDPPIPPVPITIHSIKFQTTGQQFGVAELDHFWISPTKEVNNLSCEKKMEYPNEFSVGDMVGRQNAKDSWVWGQFGCESVDPWIKRSGWIKFEDIDCQGDQWIKIRYSKHSEATVKIDILIDDKKYTDFLPVNQGSWEIFTETSWIKLKF